MPQLRGNEPILGLNIGGHYEDKATMQKVLHVGLLWSTIHQYFCSGVFG